MNTDATLITWGVDIDQGVYLDCHLVIPARVRREALMFRAASSVGVGFSLSNEARSVLSALQAIRMRSHVQRTKAILLEGRYEREDVEWLIKTMGVERLRQLSFNLY